MTLAHWIHHLFNPHCEICRETILDNKICKSCETLKMQLSIANIEKRQLLDSILSLTQPKLEETPLSVDYEKVKPKMMTWNVRKQMLEAEDRKAAQLLAEQNKQKKAISEQIDDLEKEVGISEGVKSNA